MAQTEQHTPGPWQVFDHYCGRDPETAGEEYARTRLIGLGQFDTIAEVRQGSDDVPGDVDANARLMAAAPELLEALKYYADQLCEGWCEQSPDCAHFDDCGGCLARRVAFKAAGASS